MKTRVLVPALFVLTLAQACAAAPHSLEVKVVGITDGDTITVLDSNELQHKVRLSGIDAPEKKQAFGDRSRRSLSDLVFGKTVRIEWSKTDRYGRFVAKVVDKGVDVNLAQISSGLAWHYKEYEQEQPKADRKAYADAETRARQGKLGLWTQPDPVPPWQWRHGLTSGPIKKSRSAICHAPDMPSYSSVKHFESFPTMEACMDAGGRPPKT